MIRALPEGLLIGVASSSFQIEGAWNAADKTPSMWDTFCEIPGSIEDNTTARDACKSYEYYERDIDMLKFLGVMFYRFSISWPRVLPTGFTNKISEEGAAYYSNLIDELLANGIQPVVTIYHWDLPQNLQNLGGWSNPLIGDWFEDYARVVFDLYGDRVKKWITINEPHQMCMFGYDEALFAPGIKSHGTGGYLCAKNAVLAHARVWHLYDEVYRSNQRGTIGITIACDYSEGLTNDPEDTIAAADAMDFAIGLYSQPIFSDAGGFPKRVVSLVAEKSKQQGYTRSRLPEFTTEEIDYVKGSSDFFGFNHYSTRFYTRKTYRRGMYPIPSYEDDAVPYGMTMALKWVKGNCNNPPIMITENGYGDYGGLHDEQRISYLYKYVNAVLDAMANGCNVLGWTVWSLMDNFEWNQGFSVKYGLFEVDFSDPKRTRKAKSSALWFRDLLATKTLKFNYTSVFDEIWF